MRVAYWRKVSLFIFNPFGRNNTVNILDLVIPKVKTIAIGESTENVVLGICPKVWCRLPKEGVIVLEVRHTAEASGASLPVFISVSGSVSTASNTRTLEDCRIKKESLSKIDEEMRRCEDILKILNVNSDITTNVTKDFKELDELRAEVKELKQLLQNISTVRPEENNIDPPTEEKENEI